MKRLFSLCMVFLSVFLFSCTWEDSGLDNDGGITAGKGFTLRYAVEGRNVATYATVTPETGEDAVKSLYLSFFQPSADNSGQYIETIEVTGSLAMNSDLPITLPTGSSLDANGAYNVLAVANLTENAYLNEVDIDNWFVLFEGKTETEAMELAKAFVGASTAGTDDGQILPDELLMNGHAVKAANTTNISLTLTRNVVRFDVINSKRIDYDLASVSVWNAYPESSVFGKGLIDYSGGQLRRFYGINNQDVDNDGIYEDVKGGLYAFENEVFSPKEADNQTTCLIIGLKANGASGPITYYRANIHPQGKGQALKRNYVYRLTITDVLAPGANTEEEAYTGVGAKLSYTVDVWNLDDNGLITEDGENILAIPTKTVRIGADGGEFTYSIYTFSPSGQSLSPLQIKSQTWEPQSNAIHASLNGNTLTVKADPITVEGEIRQGIIILTYAGMETSVSVIQSGMVSTFLEVVLPGGGIPTYGYAAGIYSGEIEVRASGNWTAKLLGNSDQGFSFSGSGPVETITNLDGSRNGKFFQVWTHKPNIESSQRKAFIVVSLDSDPESYTSVVTLKQNPQGGVDLSPKTLAFTVTNYATGQTVTIDGTTGPGSKAWTATLEGPHADMFTLSAASGDGVTSTQKSVTVTPKGQNLSGGAYTATLKVALDLDATMFTEIPITQQSSSFSLSPTSFQTIAKIGGETPLITVSTDPSFKWSATVAITGSAASDGRTLKNHEAYLVNASGANIAQGSVQPQSEKFRVAFPKVYYPNREISGITATVTVTLHDAASDPTPLTTTFTVTQAPLTSAGRNAANMRIETNAGAANANYGSIGSGYNEAFNAAIRAAFSVSNAIPATATSYVHANNYGLTGTGGAAGWGNVEAFRTGKDGVTLIAGDYDNAAGLNQSASSLKKAGYTLTGSTGGGNGKIAGAGTKIYKFLVTNGKSPIAGTVADFTGVDGIHTEASVIPSTAVAIIKTNSSTNTLLAIDPANKLIYVGEMAVFGSVSGTRQQFLNNLVWYIRYAAEYGSHFTDLLDETSTVPDLWSPVWGGNATY